MKEKIQIKQTQRDPFLKQKVWTPEQFDSSLLQSDYDTGKSFDYYLDDEGYLKIGEERIPVQNKYVDVLANAYLSLEELEKVRRYLKVIQKLNYLMKRLSKYGKKQTIYVKEFQAEEATKVLVVGSDVSHPMEERELEAGAFTYVPIEVPAGYFDLRSSINFFMEKAVDICHTSKSRDYAVIKLLKSQPLAEKAEEHIYQEPEDPLKKGNTWGRIQDWADKQSSKARQEDSLRGFDYTR